MANKKKVKKSKKRNVVLQDPQLTEERIGFGFVQRPSKLGPYLKRLKNIADDLQDLATVQFEQYNILVMDWGTGPTAANEPVEG